MDSKRVNDFFRKNLWITLLLTLLVSGIAMGVWGGYVRGYSFADSLYFTFLLFDLHPVERMEESLWQLEWARWLTFGAFAVATFRLFFEIIAPQFFYDLNIKFFYRNHIVICGLNKITIGLAEKFRNKKIIVLVEETNEYAETLKARGAKLLIGDLSDEGFFQKAKIGQASQFYTVINDDEKNVKIAQTVFSALKKTNRTIPLKCFVLIKDREMKTILEETSLFKYEIPHSFEGILFNIDEMGIKYGISTNINKILPDKIDTAPEFLLVGLTGKTEIILLNLAHCQTMQRQSFRFTIVEENASNIYLFEKKYAYLKNFVDIKFTNEINVRNHFSTIIICIDNPPDAIKKAVEIYYCFGDKAPNIIVFCNETDIFSEIFNELEKKKVFLISLFEQITNYVFELDKHIEKMAIMAHYFWNDRYKMNKEWDTMPEYFKQSNRNQILDYYLKTYIAFGEKFKDIKNRSISISDYDKDTLSIMEHRRWSLEKYAGNWTSGKRDKENGDPYKQHDCLVPWTELNEKQKAKDTDTVNLMIDILNNQNIYGS